MFQAVGVWERAWPVSDQALLRAGAMAPCLVGWVPNLASLAATFVFWSLGGVTTAELGTALLDGLSLFALMPLVSFITRPFERGAELAVSIGVGLVGVIVAAACIRFVRGTPYGLAPPMAAAFGFGGAAVLLAFLVLRWPSGFVDAWVRRAARRSDATETVAVGVGASWKPAPARFAVIRALYGSRWSARLEALWAVFVLHLTWQSGRFDLIWWFLMVNGWRAGYLRNTQPRPLPAHLPVSPRQVFVFLLAPCCVFGLLGIATRISGSARGGWGLVRGVWRALVRRTRRPAPASAELFLASHAG